MENKLLKEINDKLNLVLSLFSIKENGKEKTLLEKYQETKKEKQDFNMVKQYNLNKKRKGYLGDLKDILEDSFMRTGMPPATDKDGFFEVDSVIYNIKDNQ